MARVSVIVPTYDRPGFLTTALDRLAKQSYADFEAIIADDCGNPVNEQIVSAFSDARFTYVRRAVNLGMAENIWRALSQSSSPYVVTLHDDDFWAPDFLEKLVGLLEEHPNASVAFCDHWLVDEAGHVLVERTDENSRAYKRAGLQSGLHSSFVYYGCLVRTIPAAMAAVFRYSAIDWNEKPGDAGTVYDEWISYLATRDSQPVCYLSERLSYYRVHESSETALGASSAKQKIRMRAQYEYINRIKASDPRLANYRSHFAKANLRALGGLILACAIAREPALARERVALAKRLHPFWIGTALQFATRVPATIIEGVFRGKTLLSLLGSGSRRTT